MSAAKHTPMAQVAENFVFFLCRNGDERWPVGTKLYAESPLIDAAPTTAQMAMDFTMLVEKHLRDDSGHEHVSEATLTTAMYELRAHLAKATGAAS